jgi:hypothetical protein
MKYPSLQLIGYPGFRFGSPVHIASVLIYFERLKTVKKITCSTTQLSMGLARLAAASFPFAISFPS